MQDDTAMRRAVDLARRGWGRVAPNPMVGALVLAGDAVVAEGWHAEFGDLHAEARALRKAGKDARGATLVVTLEPCAHTGKQPPCVDAILAAGVRRVVIGAPDPNLLAAGGATKLAEAGLEVETGVERRLVERLDPAFFHRHRNTSRPWVALKLATSADFRIADWTGSSRWISGPAAREWVHWLRAGFDAIAVGGRTALADDPSLTVRGAITPRVVPHRVVFAGVAALPRTLKLIDTACDVPTTVVYRTGAEPPPEAPGVCGIVAPTLADGLGRLREAGIDSILVEGGGRLAGALLAAGLVDRFYWIQSPLLLGAEGVPAIAGMPGAALPEVTRWEVAERLALGEDTLLTLDRPGCSAD